MESPNEIQESFNQEFCEVLEYHLCETFRNSDQKEIRKLWCDGVVWNHFSKIIVIDSREIVTIAWIGEDGQSEYEMKIKFGKNSLKRYIKGSKLNDCIPSSNSMNWIELDTNKRKIEIQLK